MNEEALELLRQNNAMLKELIEYIHKVESSDYAAKRSFNSFAISANLINFIDCNICADVVAEGMKKSEKQRIQKNFEL